MNDKKSSTYTLCLTHDVDHLDLGKCGWLEKDLWAFSFNCIIRTLFRLLKGELSLKEYAVSFIYGLMMPLIKLRMFPDPYLKAIDKIVAIENKYSVRSTFYVIPKPNCPGHTPDGSPAVKNRATKYNINDYVKLFESLIDQGWEVGVHGIDGYSNLKAAIEELVILKSLFPLQKIWGVRMHWLYYNGKKTWEILAKAGYDYDSSLGWNDKIGFPYDNFYPFRHFSNGNFWILPLNVQDGALLARWRQNLSIEESWKMIENLLLEAKKRKAVVTILWHVASFAPPRMWDKLYERIIIQAQRDNASIVTAGRVISELRSETP
jgi:peptidoglycan/xylan/chitin deacetylase (PgdA/CDA1 family)